MNDNERKLEKLTKLAELLRDDTLTPSQLKKFVELLVSITGKQKDDMVQSFREMSDGFTQEAYKKVQDALFAISEKHADALLEVRQLTNKQKKAHEDMMGKCMSLIEELKSMEKQDGKDGLPGEPGKDGKDGSPDTGEEIADKLEALEGEAKLDFSALKNVPVFKGGKSGGVVARNIYQMGDVSLTALANNDVLKWDDTNKLWVNGVGGGGGGTWGSITGTLSSQTDLQSALDAKQATLVSGTNIKTINGSSLLGSGDISISGVGTGTANTIAYWDTTTSIASLATTTYPSLTELSYVKGVTSAIQTQLNAKGTGNVTKVGTPVNNQLGVWTGDGTLEGDTGLTFDTTDDTLSTAILNATSLTASEIVATNADKDLVSLAVATYPSLTELSYVKGLTSAVQTQINAKAPSTSPTFATSITGSYLTASEMLITDGSKNIVSAPVATYPSLTELTYLKGVTSAIQTQFTGKLSLTGGTMTGAITLLNTGSSGAATLTNAIYDLQIGNSLATAKFRFLPFGNDIYFDNFDTVAGALIFRTNSTTSGATELWRMSGSGHFITGTDNIYDIGASGATRPRTGYFGTSVVTPLLTLGTGSITMTGSIAATGARVTKGWFTDIESTNMPTVGGTAILTSLTAPQFTTIELGHASANTLSASGGVLSIEGKALVNLTDGGTFAADISVPDEAYGSGWNGSVEVPTKNAVYDKIQTLSGTSCLSIIPLPPAVCSGTTGTAAVATNTTAYVYQVMIPFSITVNKISIRSEGGVTAGTYDLSLYSEDGQTQIFSVTTASISADGITTTAVSSVVVPAGMYYFMLNSNGTASQNFAFYNFIGYFAATNGLLGDITSEPLLRGTLTITAGTPPATFDPTTLTDTANSAIPFRLDN